MATKPFTVKWGIDKDPKCVLVEWAGLAQGDDGAPINLGGSPDKSVQVNGTFGAGGSLIVEGSLKEDGSVYATLNDPQGNPLSFTTAKIEAVLENTNTIRPRVSGGDGTTSLTVYLLAYRK